tara:strand:- start:99 stop:524 length:426 start_codon:yes stop_codon:yes gene_type:complete
MESIFDTNSFLDEDSAGTVPTLAELMPDEDIFMLGMLAVTGAVLFFGCTPVPFRSKALVEAQLHPVVLQMYYSTGLFVPSCLLQLFIPLQFSFWAWLGSFFFVACALISYVSMRYGMCCLFILISIIVENNFESLLKKERI